MDKETCVREAIQTAQENGIPMAVVNDPIANAEDERGPYGYCPISAVKIIFSHGTIERVIYP